MYKDKLVWITGASSGIGEALAYAFKNEGARVILSARREEELNRVKSNCDKISPGNYVCRLDLTNAEEIKLVTREVYEKIGTVDVLINNGGISQRSKVIETPVEMDRRIMEVDYFGAVTLTKEVLPRMLDNGGGHIAAVSSIVGKFGFPLRSAYSAAKHALHGFFESLYAEYHKDNINVTVVIPGRIKTSISVNALTGEGKSYGKMDQGQEKGMKAEVCAKKIIKGLKRNKKEILVGGNETIMVHIRRFLPWLYYRLAQRISPV